jgi:hypothetical protein
MVSTVVLVLCTVWSARLGTGMLVIMSGVFHSQWRRQLDNLGGGGRIFISSCSALLTSFEIDCFYGL